MGTRGVSEQKHPRRVKKNYITKGRIGLIRLEKTEMKSRKG